MMYSDSWTVLKKDYGKQFSKLKQIASTHKLHYKGHLDDIIWQNNGSKLVVTVEGKVCHISIESNVEGVVSNFTALFGGLPQVTVEELAEEEREEALNSKGTKDKIYSFVLCNLPCIKNMTGAPKSWIENVVDSYKTKRDEFCTENELPLDMVESMEIYFVGESF